MATLFVTQERIKKAVGLFFYTFTDELGDEYFSFTSYGFDFACEVARGMIDSAGGYSENYKFVKIKLPKQTVSK